MRSCLIILLCVPMLLAASCGKKNSPWFDQIMASDFGIGVHLGDTQGAVHSVLGEPNNSKDVQGEANVEEFYFSQSMPVMGLDTPQLSVNFQDGVLMRLHNAYNALDPDLPKPPFIMEPVPGIKLGIRLSDFVDVLGQPTDSVITPTWVFKSKDGREIVLKAEFTENEKTGDSLCTRLQVVLVNKIAPQRGEAFEQKKTTP